MAGFTLQRRTINLTFTDGDLEGLSVVCRLDIALGMFLEFQSALAGTSNDNPEGFGESFRLFAENVLISWNLEEDGIPVAASVDGFFTLPPAVASEIITRWSSEVTELSNPLDETSSNTTLLEPIKEEKMAL